MHEKRKYTRIVIKSMDIKCTMHFDIEVRLLNMSLNGACISSNKQLNIGSEYELHFESGGKTVSIMGIVVWERIAKQQKNGLTEKQTPLYEAGIRFHDILTDSGVHLLEFIDGNIILKQLRVRLGGLRVNVVNPETSGMLADHRNFTVVKISLGGMLIESGQKMKINSRHAMELRIPKMKHRVKFLGRIASCGLTFPDTTPIRYGIGIEFLEMSEVDRHRLDRFINSLQDIKV